jgi:subtilisin family serine protease
VKQQQLPRKFLLSFLAAPLLLGSLTSAPAVAEEPLPTESIAATPSPSASESVSPSPGTEVSTVPTADPTNSPTTSPDSSATPEPSQSSAPNESASPTGEGLPEKDQEEFSLIVTFERNTSQAKQDDIVESIEGASLTEVSDITSSTSVIVATGDIQDAIRELNQTPGVKAVSEDKVKTFAMTPNDPSFSQQWYLRPWQPGSSRYGINAEAAWDKTQGSEEVVVAVLDTGKLDHPDLVGKWLPGWDFEDNNNDPTDPGDPNGQASWHGTTIAGVIAGATTNGLGIAGINWNAKILPVRVGNDDGASDSNLIKGIRWAAGLPVPGTTPNPNPAKVINISWGGDDSCSTAYQDAINAATAAGSLVVVAAGNGDSNGNAQDADFVSPANCQKVLAVSASNSSGMKTSRANYGDVVDVMAPGDDIYTTSCANYFSCSGNYNYENVDGTSYAAPIVAAVASLALSINPSFTPAELESLMRASTNQRTGYSCGAGVGGCGTGVIDAYKVVNSINGIWNTSDADLVATLPFTDGYQDQVTLQFDSTSSSPANLALLTSQGAPTSVVDWSVTPAQLPSLAYRGTSPISLTGLPAGNYLVRITQGQLSVDIPFLIGTGILHSISISKSASAVYPYIDGYLDSATITVTGRDLEGNIIPVVGDVRLNNVPVALNLVSGTATWNWAAVPKGTREIVASGFGPSASGQSKKTAKTTIIVGRSVATRASVTTNVATVYPVKDNYLDSISISFGITTNTLKAVPGSGTIRLYRGSNVSSANYFKAWTFTKTNLNADNKGSTTWDGRVSGKVRPGKYTLVVTFRSSEDGKTVRSTKAINVSDKKRVLKTKKGSWYYARDAYVNCVAASLGNCYYYNSTGIKISAYGVAGMQSSLPFPVSAASVHSWRVKTYGWSTSPSYYDIWPCSSRVFVSSCNSSDQGSVYLSGSGYTNYYWTNNYSTLGISDGYADWIITTNSYADFYAMEYQIEVRYWALQ